MRSIKKLTSRGDTIVEVMIVLAILGLALSICYATANRSLTNARQAQENAEASELVSSQIEQLRANSYLLTSNPRSPYHGDMNNSSKAFCFLDDSSIKVLPIDSNSLSNSTLYENSGCRKNDRYNIAVKRTVGTNTFTATAYWDSVTGDGQDSVTMSYNLPKGSP